MGPGRRTRVLLAAAAGCALLSLCACRPAPLRVPTSSEVKADPGAVLDRGAPPSIRAVRHGRLVCYYGDDARADRLVFPAGYSASEDLLLQDPSGHVVASPGFATGIAFGTAAVATPAACGHAGLARAVVRIEGLGG